MPSLCRDCYAIEPDGTGDRRCRACGGPRLLRHAEIGRLDIAHIDCDAFYASIEKRDNPSIRDKPVLVGGGRRGVVAAACYVARRFGVRSAMPMFKALALCPESVVIRPDMEKYAAVGREVRERMLDLTPSVEPLSIDEAFLDLGGTARLHRAPPAAVLARFASRVERELGITVSIGLSYCKFLAKVASDLDKPRGFAVIGRDGAKRFLAAQSVRLIWGVGGKLEERLTRDGITHIGDLQTMNESDLVARYGIMGRRLFHLSRGEDDRTVESERAAKSVSAETTFDEDCPSFRELRRQLWPLCEKVSARLKKAQLAARGITLKLKTAGFKLMTRAQILPQPTQLADRMFRAAEPLLAIECDGTAFRLIGIGATHLCDPAEADRPDLFEREGDKRARIERAIDRVREKLGPTAISTGRGLKS